MQPKTAHKLVARTRHLVGRDLTLQVLDPTNDRLTDCRVRILANDVIVNIKPRGPGGCVWTSTPGSRTRQRARSCI